MKELKNIWNSFLVVFPIIFIEGRQLDKLTQAFLFWTFVLVYFSIKINTPLAENDCLYDSYSSSIAFYTALAYIFSSIDVRFLHLSDNIPYNVRFYAGLVYLFLVIVKVYSNYVLHARLQYILIPRTVRASIINLSYAGILITGQITLNSSLSVTLILPAACLSIIPILRPLQRCVSQFRSLPSKYGFSHK